jgi:uncharacterized protein
VEYWDHIWIEVTFWEGVTVGLAAFIAGVMRGYSGFGSALVIVPITAAVFGPQLAVPAVIAIHLVTSVQLVPEALRDVEWQRVAPLSIAGSLGIPIGTWFLVTQEPGDIRTVISVLIILFAIMLMRGWRYSGQVNGAVMAGAGLVGGFITGFATIGGPPVVAFLLAGPFTAAQNRAAIILYFIFVQAVAVFVYWIGGLWSWPIVGICLLVAPPLMLGMWIGQRLFAKASEVAFRRVALVFLLAIGIATLFL